MSRALLRELGGHHHLRPRLPCPPSCSFSTVPPNAGVPKKGRGGLAGAGAVLAAVSIVGGSYYAMTREPQPRPIPPVSVQSPTPPSTSAEPVSPFAPPERSARDELTRRLDHLQTDLEALRKEKRDSLVDMKKKAIKEEIHTIQSGLAALDKR